MASSTPNLNLRKPTNQDLVNVATDLSANFDKIDAHVTSPTAHSGTYVPSALPSSAPTNDYTLVLADATTVVEMNKATAVTLTVPTNATVAFPAGTVIEVVQYGAGQVTIAGAVGVTLRSPGARLKTTQQYSGASLRQRAANEWLVSGDLTT